MLSHPEHVVEVLQQLHIWPHCFCYFPFSLPSTLPREVPLKHRLGINTLLSKILQQFFISCRLKTQVLTPTHVIWPPCASLTHLLCTLLSSFTLLHSHQHLRYSYQTQHIPTPGPLHVLFPLPDKCTPDLHIANSLNSFRSFLSKVTFI